MRRLLVLAAVVLAVPGAARAVPCSPLNCGSGQFILAHGTLLAVRTSVGAPLRVIDLRSGKTRWRLPPGIVNRNTLVHQDVRLLTWYDAATGARLRDALLQQHASFQLVGTSQDSSVAVLARTQTRSTTFALVSPTSQRVVKLGGDRWSFDALNGHYLFLIERLDRGYEVRLYDLASSRLQREPLKDPRDGALIQGIPFERAASSNGRYLFTLYADPSGGAMVHELDTAAGSAHCIDLPGPPAAAATWALVPDVESGTLWVVSGAAGRLLAIDAVAHVVRLHYAFARGAANGNAEAGVLAPDGEHIAFTDAQHLWIATPATAKVVVQPPHVALALGFSPDERTLWVVGERSRISPLRPRLVR